MKYKLLLLDIDGTLRPGSCERVPKENAEAVYQTLLTAMTKNYANEKEAQKP